MKKYILFLMAISTLLSCKNNAKKQETPSTSVKTAKYVLANAENSINFTAYKTTKKVGVKGFFKEVEITNNKQGDNIKDAINGAEFKIPVSSIETNNSSRNFKIITFFFKIMKETTALTGKISLTDDSNGSVDFTMNGVTEKLPFTYKITDNVFKMNAIMNVDKWNGQEAIAKLNEACKDLHKGDDGVSKTWSEVAIDITSTFK